MPDKFFLDYIFSRVVLTTIFLEYKTYFYLVPGSYENIGEGTSNFVNDIAGRKQFLNLIVET